MDKHIRSSGFAPKDSNLSRRDFIKVAGVFAGSVALAACAPQVTATPEATFTLPPTNTPVPTSTPQPEIPEAYYEISGKLKDSDYQINEKGQIMQRGKKGEFEIVEGIEVNQKGEVTLTYIGTNKDYKDKVYQIEKQTFIDSLTVIENGLTFKDEDGMSWSHDSVSKKWLPEVNRDMLYPNEFAYVEFGYLQTPEFKKHIDSLIEKNKFRKFNDKAIALKAGEIEPNYDRDLTDGIRPFFTVKREFWSRYNSKEKMPVQIGTIYRSHHIDGSPIYVIIGLWKDASDQPKPIAVIKPDWRKIDGNERGLLASITFLGFETHERIATCAYYNEDQVLESMTNQGFKSPDLVADWVMKNQEKQVSTGFIEEWAETGIINSGTELIILPWSSSHIG
jgi:hypothetical protein